MLVRQYLDYSVLLHPLPGLEGILRNLRVQRSGMRMERSHGHSSSHMWGEICLVWFGEEENMVWANSGLQLFEGECRWQKLFVVVADSFARGNSSDVQCEKFQLDIMKNVFAKSMVQHQDRETDSVLGGFQDSARQSHCWPISCGKVLLQLGRWTGLFSEVPPTNILYFCNSQSPILHCYLSCCVPWLSPFPPFSREVTPVLPRKQVFYFCLFFAHAFQWFKSVFQLCSSSTSDLFLRFDLLTYGFLGHPTHSSISSLCHLI